MSLTPVLLLHGFSGSPEAMRPLEKSLQKQGFETRTPLLAGHEGSWKQLEKTRWTDWYQSAESALLEMTESSEPVSVVGLSMGGLLTLLLALNHPQKIKAIACLATPIHLFRWVHLALPFVTKTPLRFLYRYQPKAGPDMLDRKAAQKYRDVDGMPIVGIQSVVDLQKTVRPRLAEIQMPLLLMHSPRDATAPFDSMDIIAKSVSSDIVKTVILSKSKHLVTLDYDRKLVGEEVGAFLQAPTEK